MQHGGLLFQKSKLLCMMMFFSLIILAAAVHGEPDAGREKRSCIQEVDGYAYLSENMTLAECRSAAFANAKRQAVETARTYIESKTKMEDFEIQYDLVWSSAEGAVAVLEQKDLGVEENRRYHVWIKAEVEYALTPRPASGTDSSGFAPSMDSTMDPALPLTVKVWTSRKTYRENDRIEIFMQGNRDYYARVVDITADGRIIQLLPNDYRADHFFRAGIVYRMPDQGDRFELTVASPFGEDRIVVYASEVPVGKVDMESIGQGLHNYRGNIRSLSDSVRGVFVAGRPGKEAAQFYEATWTFSTTR